MLAVRERPEDIDGQTENSMNYIYVSDLSDLVYLMLYDMVTKCTILSHPR